MIFVAVGTQLPFDRLIRTVDQWAQSSGEPGVAQIADGTYQPQALRWERFMATADFNRYLREADLIISHAGMGNIISALELRKPIIVMNRQHALGEHRNDHQADGLEWMGKLNGVYTAKSEHQLLELLSNRTALTVNGEATFARRKALVDFLDRELQRG